MANISSVGSTGSVGSTSGGGLSLFQGGQLIGGAVSDIFGGFADLSKEQGLESEAQQYELAAAYAGKEAQYSKAATAINVAMANRELYLGQGRTRAEVAGAGFGSSGSALDILRSNAQQGTLQSAALNQSGLIQTAGYEEQQQAYTTMANAANASAQSEGTAAIGSFIGSALDIATLGITSLGKLGG